VSAALAAARRSARLDAAAHRRSLRAWGRLQDEVAIVELTPEVAREAAELVTKYPLSGADAVHLASALSLDDASPLLVTWDHRLGSAAMSEGLFVAPADF
jgi:predicted nucleic acid-binding protein